jgi:ribulose 1,5-bisphosphate synthetase/thiazole synthase
MTDVVIIGAGINGSWTALHLAKQGYKTILLDQVLTFFFYIWMIYKIRLQKFNFSVSIAS